MKKSAFTLIELLVVISIIAILASIALPVFNGIMERGRATNDAANIRQLGLGMQQYLGDAEDQMFTLTSSSGSEVQTWPLTLHKKYVPDWKVFRSPFDKVTVARPQISREPGVPVSYGFNENTFDTNTTKYVSPSELIFATAVMESGLEVKFTGISEENVKLKMPTGGGKPQGTHSGRKQINVLFADWHVSSMSWRDFTMTTNEEGLRRWWPEGKPPEKK